MTTFIIQSQQATGELQTLFNPSNEQQLTQTLFLVRRQKHVTIFPHDIPFSGRQRTQRADHRPRPDYCIFKVFADAGRQ